MLNDTEDIALNFGDENADKKKRFKWVVTSFVNRKQYWN